MRKEITFTDSGDGLIPVAIYYDNDENEFDRVTLQLNDALSQITESDVEEFVEMAKQNLIDDINRIFNSTEGISENTFNVFLKHTKTHQSLQLIKDYRDQNKG